MQQRRQRDALTLELEFKVIKKEERFHTQEEILPCPPCTRGYVPKEKEGGACEEILTRCYYPCFTYVEIETLQSSTSPRSHSPVSPRPGVAFQICVSKSSAAAPELREDVPNRQW